MLFARTVCCLTSTASGAVLLSRRLSRTLLKTHAAQLRVGFSRDVYDGCRLCVLPFVLLRMHTKTRSNTRLRCTTCAHTRPLVSQCRRKVCQQTTASLKQTYAFVIQAIPRTTTERFFFSCKQHLEGKANGQNQAIRESRSFLQ